MKAVLFREHGGPEKLLYAEHPDPQPKEGEVLVRVRACALNHLDIWVRQGIPSYPISLPHISGCDIAGEILEPGPGTSSPPKGKRVFISPGISCFRCEFCLRGQDNLCVHYRILGANGGHGGYAELVRVPERNIHPIPETLSFEEAAAFPLTYLTAWHMLITLGNLRPGQNVLILAAGSGVGIAAIQIAKLAGARVMATAGSEEKLARAKALGADEAIHHHKEEIHRRAIQWSEGQGVDLVMEHVGPATFDKSVRSLKKGGILVTCGATTGPKTELDLRYVFSRQLILRGSTMGTQAELGEVSRLIFQGKLKPVIDRVLPLKEARSAQERMLSGSHFGKIVLTP